MYFTAFINKSSFADTVVYIPVHNIIPDISVGNGFPVCGISFRFGRKKTKSAKNIWKPVFEDVIILGFLMADTSLKRQKIYIFCKICHIFTLY